MPTASFKVGTIHGKIECCLLPTGHIKLIVVDTTIAQPERLDSPWRSVDLRGEKSIPPEAYLNSFNQTVEKKEHQFKVYSIE